MRYVVILAGGVGTRLWPLSRRDHPKQFTPVVFRERTLLQQTYDRLRRSFSPESMLVMTGAQYAAMVRTQLPDLPETHLLTEPLRRDTAAAIAYAAHRLRERDPEAVFSTVASDAYVVDPELYLAALTLAQDTVESSDVDAVLVGLQPTYPETEYGYIEVATSMDGRMLRAIPAIRFVEKPDAETARTYVESGRFLWNPALFTFRSDRFLTALRMYLPDHANALRALGDDDRPESIARAFAAMPAISIDYGMLEKLRSLLVIPAAFGWSDVGHWRAVHDVVQGDHTAGAPNVRHVGLDGTQNFIVAPPGKLVAIVGMSDVVIIDTSDALLVCPRNRAHEVRRVVAELERRGLTEFL